MEIRCLLCGGNFCWDEGFTYRDVFLVEQPDGNYFLYLKESGKQVSLGSIDTTWCFFDRDIYVPPAFEIERYKKLLRGENQMTGTERIKEFVSGKRYRYIGPGKGKDNITWNENGGMDFLLDGKPHQCKEGSSYFASFFDSPDPDWKWVFMGSLNYFEEVEMNDEMVQIEKLEKELARLREIVEAKKEKKIIYDRDNLYVGIDGTGEPFLLSRMDFKYSFLSGCRQWCKARDDGQKLIDCANKNSPFTIYEFSDHLEGMEFFMDKYRKYHKED